MKKRYILKNILLLSLLQLWLPALLLLVSVLLL